MKKFSRRHWAVEQLETRYAPATLLNPFTVTYLDDNGEKFFVTISKPLFDPATINNVFTFSTGSVDGDPSVHQNLTNLNLSLLPAAGITLTIDGPGANTPIGKIDATGLDLAAIIADANIGTILAGDADLSTPGLGLLQCVVLGDSGTANVIQGDLTTVKILGDVNGFLDVQGSINRFQARSLDGFGADDTGRLRIAGNLVTARFTSRLDGDNGGKRSGFIEVGGDIGKIIVAESLTGLAADSGQILCGGNIGRVFIGGEVSASGTGSNAGRISAQGNIGKVFIGGELRGGGGGKSGSIFAFGDIGSVKIGGDITGGTAVDSGSIFTQTGRIGSVSIGGSLQAGTGVRSGSIRAADDLGSLKVAGNVTGNAVRNVIISGFGQAIHGTTTDLAIGKVKVGGSVNGALILAGFSTLGVVSNEDAQIGSVTIGDSFFEASIVAGIDDGADDFFGTPDDSLFNEPTGDPNIVARIGKVTIHGDLNGSPDATDGFGFVAEEIGKLSIEGVIHALTAGPGNDAIALGNEGDFNLKEV